MKVVLAGAFGNLGVDILKALVQDGQEVVAADMAVKEIEGIHCETRVIDVTRPETLKGLCQGADVVITTVGLTRTSATTTNYDIDYQGNLNLLEEAKRAGVKHFTYISVIQADSDPKVPMLHAKALFEQKLKESGLSWVIHRPTGYFYDIAKVFMPMIEKGQVTLLGKQNVHANVIDTPDFADFIVRHMLEDNKTYNVGGKETYSYEEIARMFFAAAGKPVVIKRAPVFLFDVLAFVNKCKKNGKEAIIRFSKWTLTHELVGKDVWGDHSFKAYIESCYRK
ncbi:SDR family oxidoreductase [uncultured Ruthenibacterium sp.]|uniref:SDR family oxidoreductase n=1 Tax=uncultured Ruthenibacterium sp. TaxID=1905347 RepID=UPI00349E63E4